MAESEKNVTQLNDRIARLENESRRLLEAVRWGSRVRLILVALLALFLLVFGFLYYRLYTDIRDRRFAETTQLISERPEEFYEPLTRQMIQLFEQESPHVGEVFMAQFNEDRDKYSEALENQRNVLTENMVSTFESKLDEASKMFIESHGKVLERDFPELRDEKKMALIKDNLQDIYQQIGRRYHVHYMRERLESIAGKIDEFPRTEPKFANVPVSEQIFSEMLDLLRMMLINSENYLSPEEMEQWRALQPVEGVVQSPGAGAASDDSGTEPPADDSGSGDDDAPGDDDGATGDDDGAAGDDDGGDDDSGDGSDGN